MARPAAQTPVTSQPQRVLLRARSGYGPVPARQAISKEIELGIGTRSERPTDPQPAPRAAGWRYLCLPGIPRRRQLVFDFVQPHHRPLLFQALERCNIFTKRHADWEAGK